MSDAFSQYVALLDDIEHIPVAASEASRLSPDERAVLMVRIISFVRARVLPQTDLEVETLEARLQGDVAAVGGEQETLSGRGRHDAIIERIDDVAHADPRDGIRVQTLLYSLYDVLVSHFRDAELTAGSAFGPSQDYVPSSGWFG